MNHFYLYDTFKNHEDIISIFRHWYRILQQCMNLLVRLEVRVIFILVLSRDFCFYMADHQKGILQSKKHLQKILQEN